MDGDALVDLTSPSSKQRLAKRIDPYQQFSPLQLSGHHAAKKKQKVVELEDVGSGFMLQQMAGLERKLKNFETDKKALKIIEVDLATGGSELDRKKAAFVAAKNAADDYGKDQAKAMEDMRQLRTRNTFLRREKERIEEELTENEGKMRLHAHAHMRVNPQQKQMDLDDEMNAAQVAMQEHADGQAMAQTRFDDLSDSVASNARLWKSHSGFQIFEEHGLPFSHDTGEQLSYELKFALHQSMKKFGFPNAKYALGRKVEKTLWHDICVAAGIPVPGQSSGQGSGAKSSRLADLEAKLQALYDGNGDDEVATGDETDKNCST